MRDNTHEFLAKTKNLGDIANDVLKYINLECMRTHVEVWKERCRRVYDHNDNERAELSKA